MAEVLSEAIDVESIKGRFGWTSFNGYNILYIMRVIDGEHLKFVSVSMIRTQVLGRRIYNFNPDNYKCISAKGHYITKAEAELLNNINVQYCSNMFGNHEFIAGKDCIVRLEDALQFYTSSDV